MANLRNIKDRIISIKNTQKITKAMKMVAAAKVKKAENMVKASRPFTRALFNMFVKTYKEFKSSFYDVKADEFLSKCACLFDEREVKTVGIVIFSSNKGLAGAYCANILRFSKDLIKQYKDKGINVKLYIIGSKAVAPLKNLKDTLDFEIVKSWSKILDDISSASAYEVSTKLVDAYLNKEIDAIHLVTTRYKNMMSYKCQDWQLLPVVADEEKIRQFENKELNQELNIKEEEKVEPIGEFLPNLKDVVVKVVPMYMTNIIFQALLEATASELASRMTAMGAATNNATDMINTLTIEYNKARQAKITQDLTEVISGAGQLTK